MHSNGVYLKFIGNLTMKDIESNNGFHQSTNVIWLFEVCCSKWKWFMPLNKMTASCIDF